MTQNVIAAARMGVGTVAAKKITGKYPSKEVKETSTPNNVSAMV